VAVAVGVPGVGVAVPGVAVAVGVPGVEVAVAVAGVPVAVGVHGVKVVVGVPVEGVGVVPASEQSSSSPTPMMSPWASWAGTAFSLTVIGTNLPDPVAWQMLTLASFPRCPSSSPLED